MDNIEEKINRVVDGVVEILDREGLGGGSSEKGMFRDTLLNSIMLRDADMAKDSICPDMSGGASILSPPRGELEDEMRYALEGSVLSLNKKLGYDYFEIITHPERRPDRFDGLDLSEYIEFDKE